MPAVSILAAMGAVQFARLTHKKWISYLVLGIIFSVQVLPILRLYPYYSEMCDSGERTLMKVGTFG